MCALRRLLYGEYASKEKPRRSVDAEAKSQLHTPHLMGVNHGRRYFLAVVGLPLPCGRMPIPQRYRRRNEPSGDRRIATTAR